MVEVADAESLSDPSMLEINIVEQIEYYFGDFNMIKDKFLKQEVTKDEGWVSINTLLRFNRLAALTKDVNVILTAFKKKPSTLVEVDGELKRIRRNPDRPIPESNDQWRGAVASRTIYIKGFPVETTTLSDILKFMIPFGKIDNVFRRNYFDKALKEWKFKGSVFVSFPTREDAERFMSIGSVKFGGNDLIRKWQLDYIEEQKNERLKHKLEAKEMKNQLLKEQQEEIKKDFKKLPTGALIALSGIESKISLNELKKAVTKLGWTVAFVDYNMGDSNAYVRLQEANSAKDALSKLTNGTFEVKDVTLKAELVEGEKETEILEKMETDKNSRVVQNMMKSKGKKGKGKKNTFNKHGRNGRSESKAETMEVSSENAGVSADNGVKRKGSDDAPENTKKPKSDE